MNKTLILIQLIISSSLPNPIDDIIISKDVVDIKVIDPETSLTIDEEKSVESNENDIIVTSEVNQKYKIYSGLRRLKGIEEQEVTTILTTNFEMDGTSGDDLEDRTDSPITFNFSNNAEEEFVPNIPSDEYNSEWDLFDDTISTRRMLNNFDELSEELKETTFTVASPNVPEVKHRVSGIEEDKRNKLETIQNQNIVERIAQRTSVIKNENKYKHLESYKNYNIQEENAVQHAKMSISNLDHGRNDKKYGSKSTDFAVIQRNPFYYPSPSKIQRYNKPAIPVYDINLENFNNYKINRISPVASIQNFEYYSSKPYDRKCFNKPAVLLQKSITNYIILSKLAQATENSHKFAVGNKYFKNKKPFTSFHNKVNKNKFL